ncbi:UNVERIFIED_CONTAM: hypothetical protein PYX00_000150 [Menopon gallinae]|uniref:PDZ domain-containing protein n=1 Tax=Menopon gallinae TaxID=328185 RepID=A0AAW2I8Y9_9NEOP
MSYKDPLIKELKGHILKITEDVKGCGEITDNSSHIISLCDTLERIFQKGIIVHGWNSLDELALMMDLGNLGPKSFAYLRAAEMVRTCPKVKSPTGKLRLLIRSCLVNRCLHIPVEIMVRSHSFLTCNWYDQNDSILGNEILGEILLSVLLQCSTMCFKLDISNSKFLDITLTLPHCVYMELVPCSELGVAISFFDDKALVVHVEEKSVAAEDDRIEVGDIVDELNGQILHSGLKGKLSSIMTKGKNKPVLVKLIKARDPESGFIYPPIEVLLHKANIEIHPNLHQNLIRNKDKFCANNRIRNNVNYVGSVELGDAGHVKMIEHAILEVLKNPDNIELISVRIECHELGLKVIKEPTGELLTCNSFMEISSCGQTRRHPNYFGYIAGDNLCNLASKFTCHVFQSDCDADVQNILQSIGEGFQRTHYAV